MKKLTRPQRIALLRAQFGAWEPRGASGFQMHHRLMEEGLVTRRGNGTPVVTAKGEAALLASGPQWNTGPKRCPHCGAWRGDECNDGCIARQVRERHEQNDIAPFKGPPKETDPAEDAEPPAPDTAIEHIERAEEFADGAVELLRMAKETSAKRGVFLAQALTSLGRAVILGAEAARRGMKE